MLTFFSPEQKLFSLHHVLLCVVQLVLFLPHSQLIAKYQLMAANILCMVSKNQTVLFRNFSPLPFPKTALATIGCSEKPSSTQYGELIDSNAQRYSFPQNNFD